MLNQGRHFERIPNAFGKSEKSLESLQVADNRVFFTLCCMLLFDTLVLIMTDENKFEIEPKLFEAVNKQFESHLSVPNNSRIIFSGKFGHGKTTFLKEFFKEENKDVIYKPIFLYPVNYSVATNEDIFEYIKYDILIEMLNKDYKFNHINVDFWESVPFYIAKHPDKIVSLLLTMIPKVGKQVGAIFNHLVKLRDALNENYINSKKDISEFEQIRYFLSEIEKQKGSLYEGDIITNLINSSISTIKKEENDDADNLLPKTESVLVIDDLDRIDPEHIFRILNIFAAHFDSASSNVNKFGFDKVIIVCDIENIRNIFKAKYGIDTDFNGYIDKFYSHKVFNYDIKDGFLRYLYGMLKQAQVMNITERTRVIGGRNIEVYRDKVFESNHFLRIVLGLLIDSREIDLRNIVKWKDQYIEYNSVISIYGIPLNEIEHDICMAIKLLSHIKGGADSLKKAVNSIVLFSPLRKDYRELCTELVYIYTIPEHKNKLGSDHVHSVHFRLNNRQMSLSKQLKNLVLVDSHRNGNIDRDEMIDMFIKVIDLLSSNGVL